MRVVKSDSDTLTVELAREEFRILHQALNEVCNGPDAITDSVEFSLRMGAKPSEAKTVLKHAGHLLRSTSS